MTRLLIDIGNSRLKWTSRRHDEMSLAPAEAIAHEGDPAGAVTALAARWPGAAPTAVCVAHVTGNAHETAIRAAVERAFGRSPAFARTTAECDGLRNAYLEPARLGVDRWLMLLALWRATRGAGAVAAAGTALTFDAVDTKGQHVGGVDAPGLATMIEATLGRTRFAVGEMAAGFRAGLGQDTETCVRQGALHAAAGLLDRLGAAVEGPRWLAGGDAALLHPHLAASWQLHPDLVLQGLAAWASIQALR